jgi:C_GCAxxG_C_C family probable redox protein
MNRLHANREETLKRLVEDYLAGHHCAEMMLARLGQYYDRDFDPRLMRLATGFGGGIAERADLCGALAGGVMLIGYLYGRSDLAEDQTDCWRYCREFHERFARELGGTSCYHFTRGEFNQANHEKCAEVLERAAGILMDLLPVPRRPSGR